MSLIGYHAVQLNYVTVEQLSDAIALRTHHEMENHGSSVPLGQLMVENNYLTEDQYQDLISITALEPTISWVAGTRFSTKLRARKEQKQAVAEYVGREVTTRFGDNASIVLGSGTSTYYAFLGMIKHRSDASIYTNNAAVLASHTAFDNRIQRLATIQVGTVDKEYGVITPYLVDADTRNAIKKLTDATCDMAILSTEAFHSLYGPVCTFPPSAKFDREVLKNRQVPVWIVLDHTKVRVGPKRPDKCVLGRQVWANLKTEIKVIVNVHPDLPEEMKAVNPGLREDAAVKTKMVDLGASDELINEVLRYNKWAKSLASTERLVEVV